ncbi:hypothetical protein FACS1894206_00030 [Deltaproteobacteria bacterium]|nr:hypothetical protein FACS1894206_00030 [Deltaproteobacteria bacterium]
MAAGNAGYAPIRTYLRGHFRVLDGPEDNARAHMNTLPVSSTREEFMAASPFPEAVSRFWAQLDMKVDALLAGMQSSAMERDFPYGLEICSLSASAFEFSTVEPVVPGDWLEVIIPFRQTGVLTASGIGNVTARKAEKDGVAIFSFSFTRIQEEEREKIMRFVFKEQRRHLRKSRLAQG